MLAVRRGLRSTVALWLAHLLYSQWHNLFTLNKFRSRSDVSLGITATFSNFHKILSHHEVLGTAIVTFPSMESKFQSLAYVRVKQRKGTLHYKCTARGVQHPATSTQISIDFGAPQHNPPIVDTYLNRCHSSDCGTRCYAPNGV